MMPRDGRPPMDEIKEPPRDPGRAARLGGFVEIADVASATPYVAAWERLADAPLERNVFAEPWMLLPALDGFSESESARIGLTFDSKTKELCGVFPFVRRANWNRLPVRVVSTWIHGQTYLGTPLLHGDPEVAKRALAGFIDAVAEAPLLEFDDVSGDGEFMRLLMEVVGERRLHWLVTHSVTRPILVPRGSADEYLAAALGGDGRRKLRSKEKGLASLGPIRVALVEDAVGLEAWLENFVRIEKAGWKGQLGTALANQPADRAHFEKIVREGFRRGRVMALTLLSGEAPVALKINLKSGDEWFAYKIAYDERLARYSPGMLLEVENIRRVHALGDARTMDSCTGPTTRVFRDLWLDRRSIQAVTIATGREPGPLSLAALPLFRWMKHRAEPHVARLRRRPAYKPAPRDVAALPLASTAPWPARAAASPIALAATTAGAALGNSKEFCAVLRDAAMLQCGLVAAAEFHDGLDAFFSNFDSTKVLSALNYDAIRSEARISREPSLARRVGADCRLGSIVRVLARLSIRLDFEFLRAGSQIPPHGHARVVSGFSVIEGTVAVRRYDLVETMPDSVTLRQTFDGVLSAGEASTESDARDNVHWIVALDDTVLFRVTASDVPSRNPLPASLNVWVDPRAPLRGDGVILGRWIPEAAAREIPPFRS